jgi:hypothetical protein
MSLQLQRGASWALPDIIMPLSGRSRAPDLLWGERKRAGGSGPLYWQVMRLFAEVRPPHHVALGVAATQKLKGALRQVRQLIFNAVSKLARIRPQVSLRFGADVQDHCRALSDIERQRSFGFPVSPEDAKRNPQLVNAIVPRIFPEAEHGERAVVVPGRCTEDGARLIRCHGRNL